MSAAQRRIRDARLLSGLLPDRVVVRVGVLLRLWWLSVLLLGWVSVAQAAYLIQSVPPASLSWSGAATSIQADVIVTRYEKLTLYRYADSGASRTLDIYSSNFASNDSLSGVTPTLLGPLPQPLDSQGNPIALGQPVGLVEANAGISGTANELTENEPLFVVVDQPALPSSAFGIRPDGKRFMAVTLVVDSGATTSSYIITLVETSPGSGVYAGYFMPSASTPAPLGSTLSVQYDNYGDVSDSNTINAPSLVNIATLSAYTQSKQASISISGGTTTSTLFLSKDALRQQVAVGDMAPYRLTLGNSGAALSSVSITDTLPAGFRLRESSVKRDGKRLPVSVAADGRTFTIDAGALATDQQVTINYVAAVTATTQPGVATNIAVAASGSLRSNEARADMVVENAFFNDRAFLMGRVMVGACGDQNAPGLKGVRLYLDDGSNVVTDAQGRWHLEGVHPGTHVLQVDDDSFSRRYTLKLCDDNSRKAGNARSRFVEPQGGSVWREDFWLDAKPEVTSLMQQKMTTQLRGDHVHVRLPVANGQTEFRDVTVRLFLPDNIAPVPGSARINGSPVADGKKKENYWAFPLNAKGDYWQQELELDLTVDRTSTESGFQSILAETTGITARGDKHTLISMNQVSVDAARIDTRKFTLRPHFDENSAELSPDDDQMLEKVAEQIRGYDDIKLSVTGHSDSVPFRRNTDSLYKNNRELSLMRAYAVAERLRKLLDLPVNSIAVEGDGADFPIADNATAEGRALNRRVEVMVIRYQRVKDATLKVVEGDSGLNTTDSRQQAQKKKLPTGFNNLHDGMKVSLPVLAVNATVDSKLKPKLLINGEEVSNDRIGMTLQDPKTGLTQYTWVGVDLKQSGDYVFEVLGYGPFGNVRYKDSATITRTAAIKSIKVADSSGNVADGKTPVRVKLALTDEFGRQLASRTDLRLISGNLRPLQAEGQNDPLNLNSKLVQVDSDGYAWFEPVSNAGTYRIRLGTDSLESDELSVSVDPYLRDWIMVGFAKGTVGYSTLDKHIESMPDAEKDLYTHGESSFYARGRVKGSWLMTVAYDSRRRAGDDPHGQVLDPDAWYTLYGDDTNRLHDAPSQEKLYLRLERKDFYALFGDYNTDLTLTELSRYQRSLTGLKTEYRGKHVSANIFAAQTANGFIRDDVAGDGTSGLYQLSRNNIKPGTEQISIEVRDRFNNEVLSSESRARHIDYSIDYRTGTVYFREPVPVQDSNFNPVYIVANYEVDAGEANITGGGRVAIHDADRKIEAGVTAVHEGTEGASGDLTGVDVTWKPDEHHTVKAEAAHTGQEVSATQNSSDSAWLLEHEYLSEKFDTRVRLQQQDGGFGLGQQAGTDTDVRQASAQGRYRFSETLSANGELRRQEVLSTGNTRDSGEATLKLDQEDWRVYGGLRSVTDQVDGKHYESDQLIGGVERDLMKDRLKLSAKGETSLTGSMDDNGDYPKRLTLGADYRLNKLASVYTNQEMAWGYHRQSQETRTGVRATPWPGATVTTELGRADDEYGSRLFSHAGLAQTLQINSQWSGDFGIDRSETMSDTQAAPTFDQRRPLASGTNSTDYTAVSMGLGYKDGAWSQTNRVEYRHADTDDKITLLSGFQHRLDNVNTLLGRFYYFDRNMVVGDDEWEGQVDFSFVHRPLGGHWTLLNRSQLIFDGISDASSDLHGRRLVNNTAANFKPSERQQVALNYGARYVQESIDSNRYTGFTDLIGAEYRYNLTEHWDIGTRGSLLHSWNDDVMNVSSGVMVGYSPVQNVWLSLGYNVRGFYDSDFSGAESRIAGFVLDFRIKFDQDSLRQRR